MNGNLYAVLAAHFPRNPDAPCLILPDGRRYSYGDLEAETARYANLFAALGLKPGQRVAAQVGKSAQALFMYLGCVRAGLVFLPLNPAYQRSELEYFLRDATPGLFVCRPLMRELANELANELATQTSVAHVLELADDGSGSLNDAARKMPPTFTTVEGAPDDLAAILYTSGTTGRAKGAMLSQRNLAANALTLHQYWGWQTGDVLLHMLPTFHVHGLFVATHCALLNGSPMLFEPKFDAKRAIELFAQATVFMGVPTYYTRLLNESTLTAQACAPVRLFISGSAPLLADTFEEFRQRSGHTILERYGMTETGMLTSNPYAGERRAGTVGLPLPGVALRVADEDGRPTANGDIGHIQVKGENVFSGYWQMPEKTREEFTADEFFKTGDMGKLDADGYVSIIGRSKDLIISGGLNVYPKEIEAVIDALPGVIESAVFSVPHADFGEAVAAAVVCDADAGLTEADLIGILKNNIAHFKVPKTVHFVADLPRNSMGKVQKALLRQQYGDY